MPTRTYRIHKKTTNVRATLKPKQGYEHILSDLSPDKIPPHRSDPPRPEDKSALNRALTAMNTLRQLGESCAIVKNPMDSRVLANWNGVWEWIKYFEKHCIVQHEYPIAIEDMAAAEITLFGFLVILDEETKQAAITTPGYIALITRLWLHEEEYCLKYARIKSARGGSPFSLLLSKMMNTEFTIGGSDDIVVAGIVEGANGSVDIVAAHTMKKLHAALDATPTANLVQGCNILLLIISFYSHWHQDSFFWALMREGVAGGVTKAFYSCINRLEPPSREVESTMRMCYSIFSIMHLTQIGPSWVAQAFDGKLIQSMLLTGAFVKEQSAVECVERAVKLFNRLGQYLACRTVLRVFKQQLRDILDADIANPTVAGPLWESWLLFRDEAQERLAVLKVYDAQKNPKMTKICGFQHCPHRYFIGTDENKAMRCTGCFTVYYCSKDCQRNAWSAHRFLCTKLREKSSGPDSNPVTAEADHRFFQFLNQHYFETRLDEIIDLLISWKVIKIPQVSNFIVGFDYQAFPMKISIGKTAQFTPSQKISPQMTWFDNKNLENDAKIVREVKASKGGKITVQTRSPVLGAYWHENESFAFTFPPDFSERFCQKLEANSKGEEVLQDTT